MSIRADFQPTVDEFISDLKSFATGDYLKEEEKEFWEAPFDASVLPELRGYLEQMLDGLDALPDDPDGPQLLSVLSKTVRKLANFNRAQHDADDRHDQAGLQGDSAQEEEEDHGPDEREEHGAGHPGDDARPGDQDHGDEQP